MRRRTASEIHLQESAGEDGGGTCEDADVDAVVGVAAASSRCGAIGDALLLGGIGRLRRGCDEVMVTESAMPQRSQCHSIKFDSPAEVGLGMADWRLARPQA